MIYLQTKTNVFSMAKSPQFKCSLNNYQKSVTDCKIMSEVYVSDAASLSLLLEFCFHCRLLRSYLLGIHFLSLLLLNGPLNHALNSSSWQMLYKEIGLVRGGGSMQGERWVYLNLNIKMICTPVALDKRHLNV